MMLKAKRLIVPIVTLSLFINLISGIYIVQIKHNYESNIQLLEENNELLEENNRSLKEDNKDLIVDKKYYQRKYYDYFEYSIELEEQMGVYRNEP